MLNGEEAKISASPNLETIQADLDLLKRDLPALMGHLKIGAQDRIGGAAEQGGRSVMALQRQMQEQPLLFLLGAYRGGIPRRARADA